MIFFLRLVTVDETWSHYYKPENKAQTFLDFLPKRSTITGVNYANFLDQLRTAIREKRRGKLSKGVLLQQNNVRVHTCKLQWML